MSQVKDLRPELLVIVNAEDKTLRVYLNTILAESALAAWKEHDEAYCDGRIPDEGYMNLDDYMKHVGVEELTTEEHWDLLP